MTKRVQLLDTPQVRVRPGDAVDVQVPAKGATGHVWTVDVDPTQVKVIGHVKKPGEDSFGAGGVEIFTLQPLEAGSSSVRFKLGAPWRTTPAEEHELRLDVSPANSEQGD